MDWQIQVNKQQAETDYFLQNLEGITCLWHFVAVILTTFYAVYTSVMSKPFIQPEWSDINRGSV